MQIVSDVTIRYAVPPPVLLLMIAVKDSMSKIRNNRQHQCNVCLFTAHISVT